MLVKELILMLLTSDIVCLGSYMKNICFLIGNLNNSGGTERVTSLIANELSKQDYVISILSLAAGRTPFFKLEPTIKTYSLYSQTISFKKHFLLVTWKIRQFVKEHKIDTLIVVDSIACMFTVPALVGLDINHICWEHFNFNNNNDVKFRDIGRQWAAKYCDYIVTLTQRDKALWQQGLNNINANIVAIGNPSPYENIQHSPSISGRVILGVGRLTKQKGFDILLEAWAQVCSINTDWTLRIVGDGEDVVALKNKAKTLGVEMHVDFIAATKDIEHYYQTSSFFVLSSRFEGLPMVLLEAQAFSLPIIAFDCDTGPSELIDEGVNGWLVKNGDIGALAKQLLKSISLDEDSYIEMSKKAQLSSQRFSVSNVTQIWLDIL